MSNSSNSATKDLPLAGLRILDLSRVLAGPYCTQILSDYGASVVKVEQPRVGDETRQWRASGESQFWKDEGDKMSLYFSSVNRNKRSMTLNLKSPSGVGIARKLAAESDVLVHNFVPGSLEAMGLGYNDLKQINSRLIYASVSGYGTSGPNRTRSGYDGIALGEAGCYTLPESPMADQPSQALPSWICARDTTRTARS
jgi:succinate--hydroxymethylglutarate CoA-transferase